MLPFKWRHFRLHHKPLTCIQSLLAVTVWNILEGACIFYAVTSNKRMHIFNDVASHLVSWSDLKGESLPGKWQLCRQRCSETHEKCFCDSHSLSKCPCNTRECWFHNHPFEEALLQLDPSSQFPSEAKHNSLSVWPGFGRFQHWPTCQWDCPAINNSAAK